jgi:hypothetical protein
LIEIELGCLGNTLGYPGAQVVPDRSALLTLGLTRLTHRLNRKGAARLYRIRKYTANKKMYSKFMKLIKEYW